MAHASVGMNSPAWCWTTTTTAIVGPLDGLAILSTFFRLWHRWWQGSMWWDDVWAGIALFADMAGLVSVILEQPTLDIGHPYMSSIGRWVGVCSFPTIMWSARLSILTSIVRVSQPEIVLRRVALCIGLVFGAMWICMIVQRLITCIYLSCRMSIAVAITQTAGDCLADTLLTLLPIRFLRNVRLRRDCRILVFTAFSATVIINVVTIVHATLLFKPATTDVLVVAHVKTSLAVVICNLLVIATFFYRVLHGGRACLEESSTVKSRVELTTIEPDLAEWTQETSDGPMSPCSSNLSRSSTWSFKAPTAVLGPSRAQGETRQEAR